MKIKTEKKVIEEVEIELPCFRKYGTIRYKVIDEETAFSVTKDTLMKCHVASALESTEESTEEEFNEAFDKFLLTYGLTKL